MKKIISPVIIFFFTASCFAQGVNLASSEKTKQQAIVEVMKSYNSLIHAIETHDTVLLRTLLAADFTMNGNVSAKDYFASCLQTTTDSMAMFDADFTVYAQAVKAEYVMFWKGKQNEQPVEKHLMSTDVWLFRDGRFYLQTNLVKAMPRD